MQTKPADLGPKTANVLSFTGVQSTALTLAKKFPLEDRLASVFQIAKHGDLIITGKDLKSAQKALKESVKAFDNAIKITAVCARIVIRFAVFYAGRKLLHNTYIYQRKQVWQS